jgi:hypothetical protein
MTLFRERSREMHDLLHIVTRYGDLVNTAELWQS